MSECWDCGSTEKELRPYGPGGALTCFPCAFGTPEREAATKAAFMGLLDAAETISPTGAIVIGQPEGPQPFDPEQLEGP
jgi:hypothetical protein